MNHIRFRIKVLIIKAFLVLLYACQDFSGFECFETQEGCQVAGSQDMQMIQSTLDSDTLFELADNGLADSGLADNGLADSGLEASDYTLAGTEPDSFLDHVMAGNELIDMDMEQVCEPNFQLSCDGAALYWFDSCGRRGQLSQECSADERCVNEPPSCKKIAPCEQSMQCPMIEWVQFPSGTFQMGSNELPTTRPPHEVNINQFEIMRHEITVGQYRSCVVAEQCQVPPASLGQYCNWTATPEDRENYPINCISWFDLMHFAAWVGARLPSEAEWAYAAKTQNQSSRYYWGDQEPNCDLADYGGAGCGDGSSPVCSHLDENGPLCDMAGNIREWVLDEYHSSFDQAPTDGSAWCFGQCPVNADDSNYSENDDNLRVTRGGAWNSGPEQLEIISRIPESPVSSLGHLGGRLVR